MDNKIDFESTLSDQNEIFIFLFCKKNCKHFRQSLLRTVNLRDIDSTRKDQRGANWQLPRFPINVFSKKDFAIMFSLSSSIFLSFLMSKRKTAGRPHQQEQLLHEIRS